LIRLESRFEANFAKLERDLAHLRAKRGERPKGVPLNPGAPP